MLTAPMFDFNRLRSLTEPEQDLELRKDVALYPDLKGELDWARKVWGWRLSRIIVLNKLKTVYPDVDMNDLTTLFACYDRVYG